MASYCPVIGIVNDATLSKPWLTELGHESFGMQVVLSDGEDSVMYLVDEGAL